MGYVDLGNGVAPASEHTVGYAAISGATTADAGPLGVTCVVGTATAGTYYYSALVASGGVAPYTFSIIAGTTPPGLIFDTRAGTFYGVPTTGGTYTFLVRVLDDTGAASQTTHTCTVVVAGPPPPPILPPWTPGACEAGILP